MKLSYFFIFAVLTSSFFLLSLSAFAHHHHHDGYDGDRHASRWMKRVDKDDDGLISLKESTAIGEKIFKRIDDNDDGIINADERPRRRKAKRMARFLELDGDTGDISKQMVMEKIAQFHREADTDQDGKLSADEIRTFRQEQQFKRLDTNNDGSVSRQEFLEARQKRGKE